MGLGCTTCSAMSGNGAPMPSTVPTKVPPRAAPLGPPMAPRPASFAAGRGTATRATGGLRTAAGTARRSASGSLAFAAPEFTVKATSDLRGSGAEGRGGAKGGSGATEPRRPARSAATARHEAAEFFRIRRPPRLGQPLIPAVGKIDSLTGAAPSCRRRQASTTFLGCNNENRGWRPGACPRA